MTLDAQQAYQRLIEFYGLPVWRVALSPVDELVSTILSQNTNDLNRDRAYNALKQRYPNWDKVMNAPLEELISVIRQAGLANQKGARIQALLNDIAREANFNNRPVFDLSFIKDMTVEEARTWLLQFKGVGPKTAAIVMQFSLGIPAFPVDTHIYRVTGRIGLRPPKMTVEETHKFMESELSPDMYYAAHLNFIRLGREICQARKPKCSICPLQDGCDFANTSHHGNDRIS